MYGKKEEKIESCLSLPGISIRTKRHSAVQIHGWEVSRDEKTGKPAVRKEMGQYDGTEAVIWQHEIDHLNGHLIAGNLSQPWDETEDVQDGLSRLEKWF